MEQSQEDQDVGVLLRWEGGKTRVSEQDVMLCLMISMSMSDGYVACKVNSGRTVGGKPLIYRFLHNVIMQHSDPAFPVDHINAITWDNRRSNLRIISRAENVIRPQRVDDEEEARLLRDYADGKLDTSIHEYIRKRRESGKL